MTERRYRDLPLSPKYQINDCTSEEDAVRKFKDAKEAVRLLGESSFTVSLYKDEVPDYRTLVIVTREDDRYIITPSSEASISAFNLGKLIDTDREVSIESIDERGYLETKLSGTNVLGRISLSGPYRRYANLEINGIQYEINNGNTDEWKEDY